MWKFIINNTTNNLKDEIRIKVVKASKTNGLKQQILTIIDAEQSKRSFNKYEAINAINSIERTKFYRKRGQTLVPAASLKYKAVRDIQDNDENRMYKIEYLQGNLIFHLP